MIVEITNDEGLFVTLSTFGASLVGLTFPDKEQRKVDCVLGFDTEEEYLKDTAYLGRTVGRICNRIRNGRFEFDGKEFQLPLNDGYHHLHSGKHGIALRDWEIVRHGPMSATFRIRTSEEVDRLPGDATIDVTYTVNDRNQLVVEHSATCTRDGVLSLTNHAYWNLDGSDTVAEHTIRVEAHEYLPTDETCCPTGAQLSVKTTKFDLNEPKKLGELRDERGVIAIDNDLVLDQKSPRRGNILRLSSSVSGIVLDISTSYPCVHLYGSEHLFTLGKGGVAYGPGRGLAIEPQIHTAAVNYSNFPSVRLNAGQTYCHEIVYSLSRE